MKGTLCSPQACSSSLERVREVLVEHEAAVPFRRGHAGALVEHRAGAVGQPMAEQAGAEGVLVLVIGDPAVDEVGELGAVGHVVYDQDVRLAAGVELPEDVTADEPGAAGNDDHAAPPVSSPSTDR